MMVKKTGDLLRLRQRRQSHLLGTFWNPAEPQGFNFRISLR
jgi:hypothetical protein